MRILHTSDWHLGQHFYGKSRAQEHQKFLDWLLEQVAHYQIDVIIIAGDIFDTGTPASYAREMYFDFVVKVKGLNCQLVILAGNHDSVAMLGESKQVLASLSTKVIPSVTEDMDEQVFMLNNKAGEQAAVICAVPFIRPRDVIKSQAGHSSEQKQTQLQQSIAEHYQHLYDRAQELANGRLPLIATGHLTAVGAKASDSVRDIYIGTLDAIPASIFPPFDYIALGHIHRPQVVAKSEHIRYSGSPIPLSFDEAGQEKQLIMIELEQNAVTQITPIKIPCFQPMMMVKTDLDKLGTEIESVLKAHDNQASIWLDIEIESGDYLQDLQQRIEDLVAGTAIEVLLVRRSKKARQSMTGQQKKITLNELTLDEVFSARLDLEEWQTDEEQHRKQQLTDLFRKISHDTLDESSPAVFGALEQA